MKNPKISLFKYLEFTFQQASYKCNQEFSIALDGESKAAHVLLGWSRTWAKWIKVPGLMFRFFFVKLGIKDAPEAVLIVPKPDLKAVPEPDPNQPSPA